MKFILVMHEDVTFACVCACNINICTHPHAHTLLVVTIIILLKKYCFSFCQLMLIYLVFYLLFSYLKCIEINKLS